MHNKTRFIFLYKPNLGANPINKQMTAIIEREGSDYVSFCPELDIANQGDTIQEARENLREALGSVDISHR